MSRIKENLMGYDWQSFKDNDDPLYTRAINELVEYDVHYMSLTEMYHIVTNAKIDHYVRTAHMAPCTSAGAPRRYEQRAYAPDHALTPQSPPNPHSP